jgi:hypothetical protein
MFKMNRKHYNGIYIIELNIKEPILAILHYLNLLSYRILR